MSDKRTSPNRLWWGLPAVVVILLPLATAIVISIGQGHPGALNWLLRDFVNRYETAVLLLISAATLCLLIGAFLSYRDAARRGGG